MFLGFMLEAGDLVSHPNILQLSPKQVPPCTNPSAAEEVYRVDWAIGANEHQGIGWCGQPFRPQALMFLRLKV